MQFVVARLATVPPESPLQLTKPRSQVEAIIDRHLEEGRKLSDSAQGVSTEAEYQKWRERWERWVNLTAEGLISAYTGSEPAQELQSASRTAAIIGGDVNREFGWEREALGRGINVLQSLRERLEYLEAPGDASQPEPARATKPGEEQIFIVHGHAEDTKEAVCRLLEKTGDHAIVVLHEQPNEGRTLIEKFEDHAGASDFAVVLLTADDVGGSVAAEGELPTLLPRGRQNVVFELGFFVGRLGRSRVVALIDESVEQPSDFKGVVYIPLGNDSWRFKLLQELRGAGLSFDLNKLPT